MTPPWEWRGNSFIFGGKAGYFLGTSLTKLQWVCLYQYHLEQPSSKVRSAGACCRLPLVRRVTALSGVFHRVTRLYFSASGLFAWLPVRNLSF